MSFMVNTLFYIQFTMVGQVSLVFLIRVSSQLKMDGFHRRAPSYAPFLENVRLVLRPHSQQKPERQGMKDAPVDDNAPKGPAAKFPGN